MVRHEKALCERVRIFLLVYIDHEERTSGGDFRETSDDTRKGGGGWRKIRMS